MKSFVVLDIETAHAVDWKAIRDRGQPSGFKAHDDLAWNDVLPAQVCAVRYDDGVEADRVYTTIHWADRAPFENPYCRLTAEEVQAGCSPATFFEMLADVASGAEAFVGYNVGFDMGSLRHHAAGTPYLTSCVTGSRRRQSTDGHARHPVHPSGLASCQHDLQ